MQVQRINVTIAGDAADLHARLTGDGVVAWCAVYVYPVTFAGPDKAASRPLVSGYWYEPADPVAVLTACGVLP